MHVFSTDILDSSQHIAKRVLAKTVKLSVLFGSDEPITRLTGLNK